MSQPISYCMWVKATKDEKAYQWLLDATIYNSTQFAYTTFPCECEPQCRATKAAIRKVEARLKKDMDAHQAKVAADFKKRYPNGLPKFDKFCFPAIKGWENIPPMPDIRDLFASP